MAENNPIEGLETQLKENKEVNEEIGPTEKEKLTEEEKQPPTTMAEELKSPATSEDFFGFESEPTELIELLKNDESVLKALKSSARPKLVKEEQINSTPLEESVRRSGRARVENRRFADAFFISPFCPRSSPKKSKNEVKVESDGLAETPEPGRRKVGRPRKSTKSDLECSTDDEKPAEKQNDLITPPRRGRPKKVVGESPATAEIIVKAEVMLPLKTEPSVNQEECQSQSSSKTAPIARVADEMKSEIIEESVNLKIEADEEEKHNSSWDGDAFPVVDCVTAVDPLTESDIKKWTGSEDHYEIPFSSESLKVKINVTEGAVVPTGRSRTGLRIKGPKPKSVKIRENREKVIKTVPTTSNGDSSTEMVRRLNVRRSFLDILLARSKESDDLLLSNEEVKKVAVSMEAELYKLHADTGVKYRDQFKLLQNHLKNPHNKGLYHKILTAELSPAKLVNLSPGDLDSKKFFIAEAKKPAAKLGSGWPLAGNKGITTSKNGSSGGIDGILDQLMTDTTSQHKAHLFDLNCRICTKKEPEPVETPASKLASATNRAPTPTGTKVSGYIQRNGVLDPVFTVAVPRMSDPLQLDEFEPRRGDIASPSSSISSTGLEGKPIPPDSLAEKWKSKQPDQWRGKVVMPELFKFHTVAVNVTGPHIGHSELPPVLSIVGRIDPMEVWKYISSVKRAGVKVFSVIRFAEPTTEEDQCQYAGFFDNMVVKERYCVAQFPTHKNIKDFYIMPLAADEEIPAEIVPFEGPGIPESRGNILLGLVVRHRLVQKPKTSVQFDSNVSTHQIPVQAGTPAVPIIPAVPANTVPLTAPVVYAAPTMGLGEEQIRQLIRGVTASADPHAAFQQLLQCYGSAMSEQDKQFLLRELEKGGGHPGSSQMNPLTPGVPVVPGLLPPELSAFMSQMPQFLNTSVAAGSPEFAALQQQFMGLMQMMMTTMMSVSANPITQPAVVAPTATFPTPNTTTNDSDSSRESGKMKSSRNRRMSHTSTSSSSESSEEGELTTSHRIRMSSRKHRSRPHTPDHSTERRRRQSSAEITQDHTWGSSSINVTKKFDKRYEDADNLGSAASASRNEFVDSKRPRLDYGDVGDVPVASSDTFGTGGT